MSKQIIFLLIVIIIVLGVGYSAYMYLQPVPSFAPFYLLLPDKISIFLKDLKAQTNIDFSFLEDTEFEWLEEYDSKTNELVIKGKGFAAKNIPTEKYDSIEPFFLEKGFKKDFSNVADGTVSSLIGYKKDKIVCIVISGFSEHKQTIEQVALPPPDKKDIEVKCGELY